MQRQTGRGVAGGAGRGFSGRGGFQQGGGSHFQQRGPGAYACPTAILRQLCCHISLFYSTGD